MTAPTGEHEQAYIAEISRRLRDVPFVQRRPLVEQATDHLAERPPADSPAELSDALGSPDDYAAILRSAAGLPSRFSRWERIRGQRSGSLIAEMTVVIALVLGSIGTWTWFTAVPTIVNPCFGTYASEVETLEAAGVSERVVTYHAQERLGILVCPLSRDSGVTIERIRIPQPRVALAEPVGYEVPVVESGGKFMGRAGPLQPFDAHAGGSHSGQIRIWLEFDNCGTEGFHSTRFDRLRVGYKYRWRHRTVDLDLLDVTTITDDGCFEDPESQMERDRAAARIAAESAAWWAAMPAGYERVLGSAVRGPLDLRLESIGRDLCRYLRGVLPNRGTHGLVPGAVEPLEARAVFNLGDEHDRLAVEIIDASLDAFCPEFADRRDELVAIVTNR